MQFAAPTHEHGDVLPLPSVRDADAENRDDRTDGPPTGPRRLRVPEMRVCDERLGVTRDGPPDGPAGRGYQLTHPPRFPPRNILPPPRDDISAALPPTLSARTDAVIE
jgi:hypothetical protein